MPRFRDRRDAGRILGEQLADYAGRDDVVVLALPRGGVPVGYEVARALGALLDVFVVRKLGVPGREELALGAVASGGVRVLNEDVVTALGLSEREIEPIAKRESAEVERRERAYRADRRPPRPAGEDGDPGRRRTCDGSDDAGGGAGGAPIRPAVGRHRRSRRGRRDVCSAA